MPERGAYAFAQHLVVPWLGKEAIQRPEIDRLHDRVEVGVARQHDPERVGIHLLHLAQEFGAAGPLHALVAQDHVHGMQRQQLEPLGRARRRQDVIAVAAQQAVERGEHARLVVDDEQGAPRHRGHQVRRQRQAGALAQHRLELRRRQRPAEVEALDLIAAIAPEQGQLGHGFHALGDDVELQAVRHPDDRFGDGGVVGIGRDVADEGDIDFQRIERQPFQVGQAGVAGAEVVDRHAHAPRPQAVQGGDRAFHVVHQRAFGHFELQHAGVDAMRVDRIQHGLLQAAARELAARDVDGDMHRRRHDAGPRGDLAACGVDHPVADVDDQAGLLEHGNEFPRRYQALPRAVPAQQGLRARDAAGVDLGLGLVVEDELPVADRLVQCVLERQPVPRLGIHFIREEVASSPLLGPRLVQGDIGILEQGRRVGGIGRIERDADAGRHREVLRLEGEGPLQRRPDAIVDLQHLMLQLLSRQYQLELVPADAAQGGAHGYAVAQALRELAQQLVTADVAERIVDVFEAVQVDRHHGDRLARALRLRERLVERGVQQHAVRQAGHGVEAGQAQAVFARLGVQQPHLEHIADAREHLDLVERLADEILGPRFQRAQLVRGLGGDHQHRQIALAFQRPQAFEDLEPVHVRHVQVEHDDVVAVGAMQVEHGARVGHERDAGVAGVFEHVAEQLDVRFLVVDDQDAGPVNVG
ncbi:hypothetical protein ASC93_05445 [Massilia sp. Root335]|nr:hypothetical protein ASC93_05445 [Massilia sp. Root335]